MKNFGLLVASCLLSGAAMLQAQAPAGATGVCKDGSYSTAASKDGACRGHKGVQSWYAAGKAGPGSSSADAATAGSMSGMTGMSGKGAAMSGKTAPGNTGAKSAPMASAGPAPAGATGQCKDGSYSNAASKDGACRGHKGVQAWFAGGGSAATAQTRTPSPASQAGTMNGGGMMPAAKQTPAGGQASAKGAGGSATSQPLPAQKAGGGPGQVWVNTSTKVYHCSGDRYYGRTKEGAYMSEADARTKGFHADAGKACTK